MLAECKSENIFPLIESSVDNGFIASRLEEMGILLKQQGANPFRVKAYLNAARTIRSCNKNITSLVKDLGKESLIKLRLPGIGKSMASSIVSLANHGHLGYLQKLREESDAQTLLSLVPTIGPELAELLHDRLKVETLYDLEHALKSNKLRFVPGIGEKRERAIREFFISRSFQKHFRKNQPTVAELLQLDEKYRRLVATNQLPKIMPNNSRGNGRWLPVWHTETESGHYTIMYSNTERAYRHGKTMDWVVIYRDGPEHGQWTIITSGHGAMFGKRIVCGQEKETIKFYKR